VIGEKLWDDLHNRDILSALVYKITEFISELQNLGRMILLIIVWLNPRCNKVSLIS
jgi:hypothetical protein